jgi:hypothetical protein
MFESFQKISRFSKPSVFTEKIDGTNAQIYIPEDFYDLPVDEQRFAFTCEDGTKILAGSRSRWLGPGKLDNFAFYHWAELNKDELKKLGPGRHFGEWWGRGIQRGYDLDHKRYSLFNTARWGTHNPNTPSCCHVVPVLNIGPITEIDEWMEKLKLYGSYAAPGFMDPEGIVIFHEKNLYKKTFEYDRGKWDVPIVALP